MASDKDLIDTLQKKMLEYRDMQKKHLQLIEQIGELSNRLRESEELKSHFLSNIRNEINNPLSSILGLTRMLVEAHDFSPEKLRHHAFLIYNETLNLHFQMRNIFAAADTEAGQLSPVPVHLNFNQLIEEVISSFKHKAEGKNVKMRFYRAERDFVFTDPSLLEVIISNLVANAVEFTKEGSEISISATIDKDVHVAVRDYGPGIDINHTTRIYNRFFQLEHGPAKSHLGHGLGLSVAKELCEVLEGSLSFENADGGGTIFRCVLPLREVAAQDLHLEENLQEFLFDNDQIL